MEDQFLQHTPSSIFLTFHSPIQQNFEGFSRPKTKQRGREGEEELKTAKNNQHDPLGLKSTNIKKNNR